MANGQQPMARRSALHQFATEPSGSRPFATNGVRPLVGVDGLLTKGTSSDIVLPVATGRPSQEGRPTPPPIHDLQFAIRDWQVSSRFHVSPSFLLDCSLFRVG